MAERIQSDESGPSKPTQEQLRVLATMLQSQSRLTLALSELVACIGGAMLQLRSYERGVLWHDDIVGQLKQDLVSLVASMLEDIATGLDREVDFTDRKAVLEVVDALLALPYQQRLDKLLSAYKPAFKPTSIAVYLTGLLRVQLTRCLDNVVRWLVALRVAADAAVTAGCIRNDRATLSTELGDGLKVSFKLCYDEIDIAFDSAEPRLDEMARAEDVAFRYAVSQDMSEVDAFAHVQTRYRAKIEKIINESGNKTPDIPAGHG